MILQEKIITIFGGTGFLGAYLIRRLASEGYRIRVLARNPSKHHALLTSGYVGQIALIKTDSVQDLSENELERLIAGSNAVINLTGVTWQKRHGTFRSIHTTFPGRLAIVISRLGISHFTHISTLGADKIRNSLYFRSKIEGEKLLLDAMPNAVIVRPSLMLGFNDRVSRTFIRLALCLPIVPIFFPNTKLQPVRAEAVADLIVTSLTEHGVIYEIAGTKILTFSGLVKQILASHNLSRPVIAMPKFLAYCLAVLSKIKLGSPIITYDQIVILTSDNVISDNKAVKQVIV